MLLRPALAAAALLLAPLAAGAVFVPHIVTSSQKVSDTSGDLSDPNNPGTNPGGYLTDGERLGYAVPLGDFNGDGVEDLAVGARFQASGGAVHLLFLNANGTVKRRVRIGDGDGVPPLALTPADHFGAVTNLGDVDGDGIDDLAVGAAFDNTAAADAGAFYILFLNADGTLRTHQKITTGQGGGPALIASDYLGMSTAGLGDLDGDGVPDVAVGASADDISGNGDGALYIFFLKGGIGEPNPGTVKSTLKIGAGSNGFVGPVLGFKASFGSSLALLGDLDGDLRPELAVGSERSDQSGLGADTGSVWILSLRSAAAGDGAVDIGKVFDEANINDTTPGFPSPNLQAGDRMGQGLGALGDYDADGVADLAVMSSGFAVDPRAHGAVHLLYLNADKTLKAWDLISESRGCFPGGLGEGAGFGWGSMAALGDLSGDGTKELVVGAFGDDDGGTDRGAVYVLSLEQPVNPGPDHQLVCASLELEINAAGNDLWGLVNPVDTPVISVRQGTAAPLAVAVNGSGAFQLQDSALPFGYGTVAHPFGPGTEPFTVPALRYQIVDPWAASFAPNAGLPLSHPATPRVRIEGGGLRGLAANVLSAPFSKLTTSTSPPLAGNPRNLPLLLGRTGSRVTKQTQTTTTSTFSGTVTSTTTQATAYALPWTAGTAKVMFKTGAGLGVPNATTTRRGIDARTGAFAGHVSMVTPVAIRRTVSRTGDLPSFGRLNLTFVPEPAPLLGLAAGAVFLAAMVRRRLRR